MKVLPDNWAQIRLREIRRDEATTIDPRERPNEIFELFSVPAYVHGQPECVPGRDIGSTKQTVVPGTVLVCKINPRINRVWVVHEARGKRQIASTEWIPLFPSGGVDPTFVAHQLRQDQFRNYLAQNVSGVGGSLMRVRPAVLDPYAICLPPWPEQHRIVETIESYFTRLDDAAATLERIQRNLKRYRDSVLKAAVEGRLVPTEADLARAEGGDYEPAEMLLDRILAERRRHWEDAGSRGCYQEPVRSDTSGMSDLPEGWCWASIDQLAAGTLIGLVRNQEQQRPSAPYGYVKMDQIDLRGGLDLSSDRMTRVEASPDDVSKFSLQDGDILFNTRNSVELVGKSAIVAIPPPGTLFNNNIMRIRVASSMSSRFLALYMLSRPFLNQIDRIKKATTSVAAVYARDLLPCLVALPPEKEQARIAAEIDRLLSKAEYSHNAVLAMHDRIPRLRQSILKWAFEGRLADQDPTDEPASVLLARIKAERAAATPTSGRRSNGRPRKTA